MKQFVRIHRHYFYFRGNQRGILDMLTKPNTWTKSMKVQKQKIFGNIKLNWNRRSYQ